MAAEVIDLLAAVPTGLVVDATVGGGGHARALLTARPDLRLLGIDRDPVAVAAAGAALEPFGDRVRIVQGGFEQSRRNRGRVERNEGIVAILFDLGRQQPAARPSRAGLLVLGRRRAARHADGQRADADRRRRSSTSTPRPTSPRSSRATARSASPAASRPRSSPPARCATTGELVEAVKRGDPGRRPAGAVATPRGARSRPSAWR